jgi:Uma2 family endonuclease
MSQSAREPRRHRLTVEDYYRMGEVGILAPDARVELIEGEIIDMAPIGSPHVATVLYLDRILQAAVRDRALVLVQAPIMLDDYTAPQPDIALLTPRSDYYRSALAVPRDVLLIVEVAQSSLRYDRGTKLPLYAHHAIPEVWLIDAAKPALTRYREPAGGAYTRIDEPDLRAAIEISMLPDLQIDLSRLLAAQS